MTYIEFFDEVSIENISACLVNSPDRVVLIGDKSKVLRRYAERYTQIFADMGKSIEFICRAVNKNNMQSIIDELTNIVCSYDDCVFDLTGGEDLYLTAIGIVSERFRDKHLQMHRFNLRNGTIIDCDRDGVTIMNRISPMLGVENNVKAYGGDVVYVNERENGTPVWDMTEDFKVDIDHMWNICKHNVRLWNAQIGVLEAAERAKNANDDELLVNVSVSHLAELLKQEGLKLVWVNGIIQTLCRRGLIYECSLDEESLRLRYKNQQVKACLTKAGQVLEMVVYIAAKEACDGDGRLVYNDVMNGVAIDWDGEIYDTEHAHTENEIDIMMMHGIVPVFVSCKNGFVDAEELYKLNTVAERFGGTYAKKVVVATALPTFGSAPEYFRQRAKDMDIRLVEGLQEMSKAELEKTVRSFWCN